MSRPRRLAETTAAVTLTVASASFSMVSLDVGERHDDHARSGVPTTLAGVASGAFNANRQVGAAIGVALFGAILTGGHEFIRQARLTFIFAAAAALLAVPVTKGLRARPEPKAARGRIPRAGTGGQTSGPTGAMRRAMRDRTSDSTT